MDIKTLEKNAWLRDMFYSGMAKAKESCSEEYRYLAMLAHDFGEPFKSLLKKQRFICSKLKEVYDEVDKSLNMYWDEELHQYVSPEEWK